MKKLYFTQKKPFTEHIYFNGSGASLLCAVLSLQFTHHGEP